MSAILSADDLNDFISPGQACIKPVETLPKQRPEAETANPYEVTTEDKVAPASNAPPAEISLTDCLACSGCVTSAEAVLISLQSHEEVLSTLEKYPSLSLDRALEEQQDGKLFVASVSPQTRASVAATYDVTAREAGHMIEHLLAGPQGLRSSGKQGSGFTWVLDTNSTREICQAACVEEVRQVMSQPATNDATINGHAHDRPKRPILASACPGWICYAEKTHPHVLPHLSRLKSPQAMTGTMLKSVLSRRFNVPPSNIWHLAVMPCFDKKLEASREELTDSCWTGSSSNEAEFEARGARDVDCVITARELVMLADRRNISFPSLPRTPLTNRHSFPDATIDGLLFSRNRMHSNPTAGPSGGYAHAVIEAFQRQCPGSVIHIERGRNADVVEYVLRAADDVGGAVILKTARYYGFRNIQNLVRKLKPTRKSRMPGAKAAPRPAAGEGAGMQEYAYIEVMACPGGCTNGGGQIKVDDVAEMRGLADGEHDGVAASVKKKLGPAEQREWLARVDEAYYSASDDEETVANGAGGLETDVGRPLLKAVNGGGDEHRIKHILDHWSETTQIPLDKLLFTSYRQVESDVGKDRTKKGAAGDMERVAGLASSIGGGW